MGIFHSYAGGGGRISLKKPTDHFFNKIILIDVTITKTDFVKILLNTHFIVNISIYIFGMNTTFFFQFNFSDRYFLTLKSR